MDTYPIAEIKDLIEKSRQHVAVTIHSEMTLLYWNIGNRIHTEILKNKRAEYGQRIVQELSRRLTEEYGRGWSQRHLFYCVKFSEVFPDKNILHTVCAKLTWSHIRLVLTIDDPLKREFYIEMCKLEKWSVRTFRERIQSMLYERTALSKKPEETIQNDLETSIIGVQSPKVGTVNISPFQGLFSFISGPFL